MAMIGGREAWKVRKQGDIGIAFHWIGTPDHGDEPSMVLFPLRKRLGSSAFVITMNKAFEYADNKGYPTPELLNSCMRAADVMAMGQDKATVHRIADVILNNIEDLVRMPPAPRKETKNPDANTGEIKLIADGQTVMEREVDLDDSA